MLVLAAAGPANAHATLERSEPTSGAQLAASPPSVVLDFDENVELGLGGITLAKADSTPIEIGTAEYLDGKSDVVAVRLPKLDAGVYVASYRVISADGHPVVGSIVFRVGSSDSDSSSPGIVAAGQQPSRAVGVVYGLARALGYLALILAIGLPCIVALIWRQGWHRVRRVVDVACLVLALATAAQFALAVPYLAGTGLADAFTASRWSQIAETASGKWWLARLAALVVFGLVALATKLLIREVRRAALLVSGAAAAAVVVASFVGDGHAGAGRYLVIGFIATAVHIVAMATWLSGLGVLAWGPMADDPYLLFGVLRRWSLVASISVAALALTGVVQTWRLLDGWSAFDSSFGRLLIVKTLAVIVMVFLGNLGRVRLSRTRRSGSSDSVQRSLRAGVLGELAVGLVVIALTTVLVQSQPSHVAGAESAPVTSVAAAKPQWQTTVTQGDWVMTISLDQTVVGRRHIEVSLDDSAAPFGDPITIRARLSLDSAGLGPIPVIFVVQGARAWSTDDVELPAAGDWKLEILLDDPATSARFDTIIPIT